MTEEIREEDDRQSEDSDEDDAVGTPLYSPTTPTGRTRGNSEAEPEGENPPGDVPAGPMDDADLEELPTIPEDRPPTRPRSSVLDDVPHSIRNTRRRLDPAVRTSPEEEMTRAGVDSSPGSLLASVVRSGATGAGVELIRQREQERNDAFVAFISERVPINKNLTKNQKKQKAGKNLNYGTCDETTRAGIDLSLIHI